MRERRACGPPSLMKAAASSGRRVRRRHSRRLAWRASGGWFGQTNSCVQHFMTLVACPTFITVNSSGSGITSRINFARHKNNIHIQNNFHIPLGFSLAAASSSGVSFRGISILRTGLWALVSAFICRLEAILFIKYIYRLPAHQGTDGRVVKALDSKSNGFCPRRFESCSVRNFFLHFTTNGLCPRRFESCSVRNFFLLFTTNGLCPRRFESCSVRNFFLHFTTNPPILYRFPFFYIKIVLMVFSPAPYLNHGSKVNDVSVATREEANNGLAVPVRCLDS